MPSRVDRLALLLVIALLESPGCGTHYARVPLIDDGSTKVLLRAELRDGKPVERGFHQPATISGARIAHVLAQIDVRLGADEAEKSSRRGAVPVDLLYPIGDQLSAALAKADPDQEVVVQALRSERRLALFTDTFLTSFLAYVGADDLLYLHFSRLDWPVPKGGEEEQREPVAGQEVMAFRVLASEGVDPIGHQSVAVHWRDDRFQNPTSVRVGPGGKVKRRTVLMEDEGAAGAAAPPAGRLPTDPASLRALADLEEARRSGALTEAEYQRQRRALLEQAAH